MLTSSICGMACRRSRICRPVVPASQSIKTLDMEVLLQKGGSGCRNRKEKKGEWEGYQPSPGCKLGTRMVRCNMIQSRVAMSQARGQTSVHGKRATTTLP